MARTVIGLIDTPQETHLVIQDLTSIGFARERIGLMSGDKQAAPSAAKKASKKAKGNEAAAAGAMAGAGTGAAVGGVAGLALALVPLAIPGIGPIVAAGPIAAALAGAGIGAVAGGLIGGLTKMGVPEDEAHYYAEGVRRGGTLVTVQADTDKEVDDAVATMKRHGAVDIEQRAAGWRKEGWSGRFEPGQAGAGAARTATGATRTKGGERTIPVVEEELVVGKRVAGEGVVRVYSYVIEQPAQETVNLREEHASIERRPVNRPLGADDAAAFREQTVEVRESVEEPVVGKRAKVVEEVSVGKQQSERQQTVSDTVRKTDVRVERTGAAGATRGAWTGAERRHNGSSPYAGTDRRRAA